MSGLPIPTCRTGLLPLAAVALLVCFFLSALSAPRALGGTTRADRTRLEAEAIEGRPDPFLDGRASRSCPLWLYWMGGSLCFGAAMAYGVLFPVLRLNGRLRNAKEQAGEALRAKGDFVATVSHELRPPMTGALGLTRLLRRTDLSREQEEYARMVARGEGVKAVSVEPADPLPSPPVPSSASVLIAEDDPVSAYFMKALLRKMGHSPEVAGTGRLALERWEAKRPRVVFMDMLMPEIDGLEAIREIRQRESRDPARERTHIIVLSAEAGEARRAESLAAGADAFLTKPVSFHDIGRALGALNLLSSAAATAKPSPCTTSPSNSPANSSNSTSC